MTIAAQDVFALRKATGVSMMACKKALTEANGDAEKAAEILRKSGEAGAAKKEGRETGEGAIAIAGRRAVALRCETDFVARGDDFLRFAAELAASDDPNAHFEAKKAEYVALLGENLTFGGVQMVEGGDTVGAYLHSNNKLAALVALTGGSEELAHDLAMHVVANAPEALSPEDVPQQVVDQEREVWVAELEKSGKPEAIRGKILEGKEKKFREAGALLCQPFLKDTEQTVADVLKGAGGAQVAGFFRLSV